MKNMKKGLALLLAGIMVLGMTACGAKEETPAAAPEPAKTEAPAKAETPAPAATDAAAPADSAIPLSLIHI